MNPVNHLGQVGSSLNQSRQQISIQEERQKANVKEMIGNQRGMLKHQNFGVDNDEIDDKLDEWLVDKFLNPNQFHAARETVGQDIDTFNKDTKGSVLDVEKLLMLIISMSVAYGALQENKQTLEEKHKSDLEKTRLEQAGRAREQESPALIQGIETDKQAFEARPQKLKNDKQKSDPALNFLEAFSDNRTLSKTGVQLLIDILENKGKYYKVQDRVKAAFVLCKQKSLPQEVCPALEAVLQDQEKKVKVGAALALSRHFPLSNSAIPILREVLAHKGTLYSTKDKAHAAFALFEQSYLPKDVRPVLENALQGQNKQIQFRAALALGRHFRLPASAFPILRDARSNSDGQYSTASRSNAAYALLKQRSLPEQTPSVSKAVLQNQREKVKFNMSFA